MFIMLLLICVIARLRPYSLRPGTRCGLSYHFRQRGSRHRIRRLRSNRSRSSSSPCHRQRSKIHGWSFRRTGSHRITSSSNQLRSSSRSVGCPLRSRSHRQPSGSRSRRVAQDGCARCPCRRQSGRIQSHRRRGSQSRSFLLTGTWQRRSHSSSQRQSHSSSQRRSHSSSHQLRLQSSRRSLCRHWPSRSHRLKIGSRSRLGAAQDGCARCLCQCPSSHSRSHRRRGSQSRSFLLTGT